MNLETQNGDSDIYQHGIDMNETNTGVQAGVALTNISGPTIITVSEAWIKDNNGGSRIMENLNFLTGSRLEIATNGTAQPVINSGIENTIIEYCELDGNNESAGAATAIGVADYTTLRRLYIHQWPRNLMTGVSISHLTIQECYFHDLYLDGSEDHTENIYIGGGTAIVIQGNKIISNGIGPQSNPMAQISASLAIYNEDWGAHVDLDDIKVTDNYFESDGQYALYGGAVSSKSAPYAKNLVIKGNIFIVQVPSKSFFSGM